MDAYQAVEVLRMRLKQPGVASSRDIKKARIALRKWIDGQPKDTMPLFAHYWLQAAAGHGYWPDASHAQYAFGLLDRLVQSRKDTLPEDWEDRRMALASEAETGRIGG